MLERPSKCHCGEAHCYNCGRKLTRKERDSFVPEYPFRVCNGCAVKEDSDHAG